MINFSFLKPSSGCFPQNPRDYLDPSQTAAIWHNQNITPLLGLQSRLSSDQRKVLGIQSQNKWLEIDLAAKKLLAHQGSDLLLTAPINTGRYFPTPIGEYFIFQKYLSVDLSGGSRLSQTYYYLPNVPYTLYFTPQLAIIGSYWSENFGGESGFGCIEVAPEIAETLYYWADSPTTSSSPGTKVVIH